MESLARALGADAVRETHTSWVFLTGDRAYKLKKPVRLAFVDLSTPAARRTACEEEVRVNAGGVVLGVRGLLPDLRLTQPDDPEATEWLVEMRRFDEGRTMAALLERGELRREDVAPAARRIARFHADAERLDRSHAASSRRSPTGRRSPPCARSATRSSAAAAPCSRSGRRPASSATATAICAPTTCSSRTVG